jgi:transcriptional regulator with XRE-family HTH domain|nr:MAG TPA: Helix-turn-helix XRE-family like protein [Caudoviricetes sp.]
MKCEVTAKRLRKALDECGMKPQELADKTGISKSSISQYLNGSHAPSNISSGKIGKVLNVEPLWLMGFDVEQRKTFDVKQGDKDFELIDKFSMLDERDKKIVLNMIESMISSENKK